MQVLRNNQCCLPVMIFRQGFESFFCTVRVCMLSHSKEFCPSNGATSKSSTHYESTNAFNTVLNIQEKKKKDPVIGQNKHHRFLKMPHVRSEALAVRLFSGPKLWDVVT